MNFNRKFLFNKLYMKSGNPYLNSSPNDKKTKLELIKLII